MEMVRGWIKGDESAKEMLVRLRLTETPFLLPPPLHRFPLRVGNVVEIVGPSSSAKTDILIQAAISCILPKNWNGVHYGGLEHLVMFVDLDCRFDILRLSQSLKHRIMETNGSITNVRRGQYDVSVSNFNSEKEPHNNYDKELVAVCMRRFLYTRCYDSFQFLATLKTMHYQVQKERKTHDAGVHLLLIDSIGAFYWSDRASGSLPLGGHNRKSLSLQSVSEAVVQEIRKLLIVHPMLVLVSKTAHLVDKSSANEVKRAQQKWSLQNDPDLNNVRNGPQKLSHREFMPSAWQGFVTHRILVQASDDGKRQNEPIYLSEWLLPSLNISDKFIVREGGIFVVS
ncbi:hypothetical protein LguiB_016953 [Lonicera macranthoides]